MKQAIVVGVIVVFVLSGFPQAQELTRVVLKVQEIKYPGDGTVILTLGPGRELSLDAAAVDRTTTENLQKVLELGDGKPAPRPVATDSDVPSLAAVQPAIRAKCAKEWPEDFSVRAYCEKTQTEALNKLRARSMTASADHQTIRRKCAREWPDDYTVRNYCEETELKALAALSK